MVFLYKNKKPAVNEIVIAHITEINELNIVANLVDYDNLTGYISYSELSRKKRYKLHKIVNVGKDVIVQVTGFNNNKNFAELSVRAVIASDIENFNKTHRAQLNLYNLWRYVYMKVNPDLNMNVDKINSQKINDFMENTFWKIENSLEDKYNELAELAELDNNSEQEIVPTYETDEVYATLIDPNKNEQLLKYVTNYDITIIKKILDEYAHNKTILVKQNKYQEFNICSFSCDGLENIKNALNCKNYGRWDELTEKYDFSILYLTGGKYSLTIKQKTPMEEDINIVYDYLINEIKTNSEKYNLVYSV